jgi:hypothetical protein
MGFVHRDFYRPKDKRGERAVPPAASRIGSIDSFREILKMPIQSAPPQCNSSRNPPIRTLRLVLKNRAGKPLEMAKETLCEFDSGIAP